MSAMVPAASCSSSLSCQPPPVLLLLACFPPIMPRPAASVSCRLLPMRRGAPGHRHRQQAAALDSGATMSTSRTYRPAMLRSLSSPPPLFRASRLFATAAGAHHVNDPSDLKSKPSPTPTSESKSKLSPTLPTFLHAEWVQVQAPAAPPPMSQLPPSQPPMPSGYPISSHAASKAPPPARSTTAVFLHGLLGSGRNLKTLARRYCQQQYQDQQQDQHQNQHQQQLQDQPPPNGLLVDLRGHGKSYRLSGGASEEEEVEDASIGLCAEDVRRTLLRHLPLQSHLPGGTNLHLHLVGHSLGGRVALQYCYDDRVRRRGRATNDNWAAHPSSSTSTDDATVPPPPPPVSRLWLLDTVPGKPNEGVVHVVNQVERFLQDYGESGRLHQVEHDGDHDRDDVSSRGGTSPTPHQHHRHHHRRSSHQEIARILRDDYQIDHGTAQWLASSYRPAGGVGGVGGASASPSFAFSVPVAKALLRNLAQQDFWEQLEAIVEEDDDADDDPNNVARLRVDLVMAGKNPLWNKAGGTAPSSPSERLRALSDRHPDTFHVHVLPDAGHWVHADDLEGLLQLMRS